MAAQLGPGLGLGQLLLDGQLDWLEEDPLGLAEAVLADTV